MRANCLCRHYIALHGFPTMVRNISLTSGHHRCSAIGIWCSIHVIWSSHDECESSKCKGLPTNAQYANNHRWEKGKTKILMCLVQWNFSFTILVFRGRMRNSPTSTLCSVSYRWRWNYLLPHRQCIVTDVCFIYNKIMFIRTRSLSNAFR